MTITTTTPIPQAVAAGADAPDTPPGGSRTDYDKRAVIYLRVSTASQVKTDRDAEGFSIPAQREACLRRAEALGAAVIDEYVDAGQSARSADRPQLQALLDRLAGQRDIDYVIVHKVDRLARSRADDVNIHLAIKQAGAHLVSVSENIDETPSGMLLHGIMSSIAEFYSGNLASEITKGMSQKAKKGIFPSRAPVGYLNARAMNDGNEIRTIAVDPERAPLIQWAFDAYASGDYTLSQLTEALADKGMTTRPTPKRPPKPLVKRHVHNLLRNTFYVGLVTWAGVEYPGTHAPLVSVGTFATVQAILHSRNQSSERQRKHNHYLKGSLFCGRCGARLSYSKSRGRGGIYEYFYCLGRRSRRTDCDLPSLAVDEVEDVVARQYRSLQLTEQTVLRLQRELLAAMRAHTSGAEKRARQQRKRITDLEGKRRKLLQAHLGGGISLELLKEEQERITRQLADAGAALAATEIHWENIETNLQVALGLALRFDEAYRQAKPTIKRRLNQAVFEELRLDTEGVTYTRLADPFAQLLAEDLLAELDAELENPGTISGGRGSNKDLLVEVTGLEPTTSTLRNVGGGRSAT